MKNDFILGILDQIEGYKTRLKELHWSSKGLNIHRLCDDFDKILRTYEDDLAELSMSLWGEIQPGDLDPIACGETDFLELLTTVLGKATEVKRKSQDSLMWAGIESTTDTFIADISKLIYQTRLEYKLL